MADPRLPLGRTQSGRYVDISPATEADHRLGAWTRAAGADR